MLALITGFNTISIAHLTYKFSKISINIYCKDSSGPQVRKQQPNPVRALFS